jgi:hypothetical protein
MVTRATDKKAVLSELERFLKKELLRSWIAQGHFINGKIVKEADFVVKESLAELEISILMFPYGAFIERGVTADEIPYSGPGGGGKSKYIQALIGYAKKRMSLPDAQAKSAAFAIATKQKKEGMPTRASQRFSKTGRRTGWIDDAIFKNTTKIRELLFQYADVVITTTFENVVTKYTTTTLE